MTKLKKTVSGYIPERVCYIQRGTADISRKNILEETETETVTPAFVSDPTNDKTMTTARTWANEKVYNYQTQKYDDHHAAQEIDGLNVPMVGIRIFSLEKRDQGGRAYKVILPGGYYVDLREDVLMDTILHAGIGENGVLLGEYIWARVGAEMKLIRMHSALHEVMIASTELGEKKKISKTKLEVGGVYRTKTGMFIYLGDVDRVEIVDTSPNKEYRTNISVQKPENQKLEDASPYTIAVFTHTHPGHYSWETAHTTEKRYTVVKHEKMQLWYQITEYAMGSRDVWNEVAAGKYTLMHLLQEKDNFYHFDFVKSKSVLEHVITLAPYDFLPILRKRAEMKEYADMAQSQQTRQDYFKSGHSKKLEPWTNEDTLASLYYYAKLMSVVPVGEDPFAVLPLDLRQEFKLK